MDKVVNFEPNTLNLVYVKWIANIFQNKFNFMIKDSFSVGKRRKDLGLPSTSTVVSWLDEGIRTAFPEKLPVKKSGLKNPEIPLLSDYSGNANESFWRKFPKRELPEKATTRVNIANLAERVESAKNRMSGTEYKRANKLLADLACGADSYQKSKLPPINCPNSPSAAENGALLTDTIATWVKKGFVAGPFETPPVAGFRANPLAVVVRNGKIRPILNMSGPKGKSFNDNVDRKKLEKLHMGTARQFGFGLKKAGKDAKFSKFDLQDAYKLIPARKEDFGLQGFCWLGRWFVETQQSFGGVPSPSNFDRLPKTIDLLACIESGTSRSQVFCALDDSPCVGQAGSGSVERFTATMKEMCEDFNVPLAENCEAAEKAFELQTRGTVLGVGFDSSSMSWFLSKEKVSKMVERCLEVEGSSHVSLKQMEKLMGTVNDLSQMCQSAKFHRREGNAFLGRFAGNYNIVLMVPTELKKELQILAKIADSAESGLPLMEESEQPSLSTLVFYTDAAGASYSMFRGEKKFHNNSGRGVACLGGESLEDIWCWCRLAWPEGFLDEQKDEKGTSFGCKSTTLEAVGMLLPFLAFPEKVKGKNVVFRIDNMAVLFGWYHGFVKNDRSASEILKCVHYLSGINGTVVNVDHVGRVSDDMAKLADELSRRDQSTDERACLALQKAERGFVTGSLLTWLKNAKEKIDLIKMIKELEMKKT